MSYRKVVLLVIALIAHPLFAQKPVLEVQPVAALPDRFTAPDGTVTVIVDWDNLVEKPATDRGPSYATTCYTVNRSAKPITLVRTTGYDSNNPTQFRTKAGRWQRSHGTPLMRGGCDVGSWRVEVVLDPGEWTEEPFTIAKGLRFSPQATRVALYVNGEVYASTERKLRVWFDPIRSNSSLHDDWAVTYGNLDYLESIIEDRVKPAKYFQSPSRTDAAVKLLAIEAMSQPWHSKTRTLKLLETIIEDGDEALTPAAVESKQMIIGRSQKTGG